MLYQKIVRFISLKNKETEKAEDVQDHFYKRDAKLNRNDDGGRDVMYSADFLCCEILPNEHVFNCSS